MDGMARFFLRQWRFMRQWSKALELYSQMKEKDIISHNSCVAEVGRANFHMVQCNIRDETRLPAKGCETLPSMVHCQR